MRRGGLMVGGGGGHVVMIELMRHCLAVVTADQHPRLGMGGYRGKSPFFRHLGDEAFRGFPLSDVIRKFGVSCVRFC